MREYLINIMRSKESAMRNLASIMLFAAVTVTFSQAFADSTTNYTERQILNMIFDQTKGAVFSDVGKAGTIPVYVTNPGGGGASGTTPVTVLNWPSTQPVSFNEPVFTIIQGTVPVAVKKTNKLCTEIVPPTSFSGEFSVTLSHEPVEYTLFNLDTSGNMTFERGGKAATNTSTVLMPGQAYMSRDGSKYFSVFSTGSGSFQIFSVYEVEL